MARLSRFAYSLLAAMLALAFIARPSVAQQKPVKNQTKGQSQLAGGNGEFGTIYSIPGFNFEILSAKYSLEPFIAYNTQRLDTNQKFLILTIAIKNTTDSNNSFGTSNIITLVDSAGQIYHDSTSELASAGTNDFSLSLRPGQGLGQPGLHDPFTIAYPIPGNARIVKIMFNKGRLGRHEDLFRYYVAGATKEEAGEAGDPKNVIAPLPVVAQDPSDKTGSTLSDPAKGATGTYEPSGVFGLRVDSVTYSTDTIYDGKPPAAGKKYLIVAMTATTKAASHPFVSYITGGNGSDRTTVETTDGDRIKPDGYWKATTDASADHRFEPGDEYHYRMFFILDKNAVVNKLTIGASGGTRWVYDISGIH